jgi:hypothetical protein
VLKSQQRQIDAEHKQLVMHIQSIVANVGRRCPAL